MATKQVVAKATAAAGGVAKITTVSYLVPAHQRSPRPD